MFGKRKEPESLAQPTPAGDAPCAWCEDETGQRTTGSHGICERHQAELLAQLKRRKRTTE